MDEHQVYLVIGSNINPQHHLPKAVELLAENCRIQAVSTAWESQAVGSDGPNFINAGLCLLTEFDLPEFNEKVIRSIESSLGRVRSTDKYAPRSIDLDIMLWDGKPFRLEQWNLAHVVLPMAEISPQLEHPITRQKLSLVAERLRTQIWTAARPDILTKYREDRLDS